MVRSTQERTQNPFKGFTVGELAWKSGASARDMANDGEQLGPEPSNRKGWNGNPTPIRATTRMAPMQTRSLLPFGSSRQRKTTALSCPGDEWNANNGTGRMKQKTAHEALGSSRRQSTSGPLKANQKQVIDVDAEISDADDEPLTFPTHELLGVRPMLRLRRDRIPKTTGATRAQEVEQSTSASAPQLAPSPTSASAVEVVSATGPAPPPAPVSVPARATENIEQPVALVRQPAPPPQVDINTARWKATFHETNSMPYGYDDASSLMGSTKKRPTVTEEDGVGREKKRSRTDTQGTGTAAAVTLSVPVPVHIPAPRLPELAPATAAVRTQESTPVPAPLTATAPARAPHPAQASAPVPVPVPVTASASPLAKLLVDRSIDATTPTPAAGTTNLNLRLERIETAQTKMSVLIKASQSAMQTDVTNRLERVESATTSISAGIETVEKLDVKVTDVETRLKCVEALLERVEASLEKVLEKIG